MIVLGINSVYHESAAAITIDGRLVAAVEEERLNRKKHGKAAQVDTPHQMPAQAIACCLKMAGLKPADVDRVAFSFDPAQRAAEFTYDVSLPGDWGDPEGEAIFRRQLAKAPAAVSEILKRDVTDRFVWVGHHMAHAASAFYPSGYDTAAILVIDGIGENASTLFARGDADGIVPLRAIQYPHSMGFLWEKLSAYLGFSEYDASKVMGMAAWGEADPWRDAIGQFARVGDGGFALNGEVLSFRRPDFEALEAILGPRRRPGEPLEARHFGIAAALQDFTSQSMLEVLSSLAELCPGENLCIAGGVALNCVSNAELLRRGPFRSMFLPPGPHDAGTAIGAALVVEHSVNGAARRVEPQLTPFTGPAFASDAIEAALARAGVEAVRVSDAPERAAAMVADGLIVGWFQGAMEFGPRALGNRSLLADPRVPKMREVLNYKVKHREPFRPFAASVLRERMTDWFDVPRWSDALMYMLFAVPARPEKARRIPAVMHADDTCRIQAVDPLLSPRYHAMISAFERMTGVPMVLNTSFNDQEPIVCSPDDALATFHGTRIDALFLEDYLVVRVNEMRTAQGERPGDVGGRMREPVVFRGVAAHWPALQRWVPERLAEMAGDRMVEVVVGDREGGAPVFESMPLRAFFTRWPEADESGAPALYLKEFNLLDALPRLAEDVDFSPYERPGATCWHDAWVSQAGGRTNLHSDLLDNTLTQIVGRKRVTLISPAWSADVYPSPKFDPYARLSLVDAFAPDFARFPRYRTALTHELQVVLEPGDAVYIPRGWWHTAQSLSASISIAGFWETRWARATVMLLEDVRRALHRVGVYKRGHCTCHPAAGQRSAA